MQLKEMSKTDRNTSVKQAHEVPKRYSAVDPEIKDLIMHTIFIDFTEV